MISPPVPDDESQRIQTLHDMCILDTRPEERFDRLARIARSHYAVPIALVSLVDTDRQWFKSCLGLDASETDRSVSFCGHAILDDEVLYVEDACKDPRFFDNPFVLGAPHIRFYAGAPISAPDGSRVGTLCIIDSKPRHFTDISFDVLRDLARCVESELADLYFRARMKRKALEKAEVLRATFDNMNQGIAVFDAQHTLVEFNARYADILGFPKNFVRVGMNRREILRYKAENGYYGAVDPVDAIEARLSVSVTPCSGERSQPDGRIYSFIRMPLAGGGYIIAVTDITEHRRAERQLHQAQKMEAVGQLTGGIAHDFNNLLAVTLGNVELAQEAIQRGAEVENYLATIKRVGERGVSLTNQLLAFSRKQKLYPESTDAGQLISEMVELLSRSLGETIEVEVARSAGLWSCEVDRHQLEGAILNLAVNARDAMPSGGTLSLRTANVSIGNGKDAVPSDMEPGDYVLLSVSDTGTGMSNDVVEHAFEPFFTTKDVGRGTGLGLSMVYGFVKQSRGQVTIVTEEGKGTTFNLYLPRCEAARGSNAASGNAITADALGETILVVEDDPEVRRLSAEMLRNLGYSIVEAGDAEQALAALQSEPKADLLFTDIVLPGGQSGLELAARIRGCHPELPVLFTSGYINHAGGNDVQLDPDKNLLRKPFTKQDLARKIRQALDGQEAPRETAQAGL